MRLTGHVTPPVADAAPSGSGSGVTSFAPDRPLVGVAAAVSAGAVLIHVGLAAQLAWSAPLLLRWSRPVLLAGAAVHAVDLTRSESLPYVVLPGGGKLLSAGCSPGRRASAARPSAAR